MKTHNGKFYSYNPTLIATEFIFAVIFKLKSCMRLLQKSRTESISYDSLKRFKTLCVNLVEDQTKYKVVGIRKDTVKYVCVCFVFNVIICRRLV